MNKRIARKYIKVPRRHKNDENNFLCVTWTPIAQKAADYLKITNIFWDYNFNPKPAMIDITWSTLPEKIMRAF